MVSTTLHRAARDRVEDDVGDWGDSDMTRGDGGRLGVTVGVQGMTERG